MNRLRPRFLECISMILISVRSRVEVGVGIILILLGENVLKSDYLSVCVSQMTF